MGKQDDYIENETEVTRVALPLLPCYKMLKSLTLQEEMALFLEMQEEVAFQQRVNKEQSAILKIKEILEKRVMLNFDLLKEMEKADNSVEIFLRFCLYPDFYLKKTTKEKQQITQELIVVDVKNIIVREIKDIQGILAKIQDNIPYLIEALYIDFDQASISEASLKNNLFYKKLHSLGSDFSLILKIISPFLTEEFEVFSAYFKMFPTFHRSIQDLTSSEMTQHTTVILDAVPYHLRKVDTLSQNTKERIRKAQLDSHFSEQGLWETLLSVANQIDPIRNKSMLSQEKLKKDVESFPYSSKGESPHFSFWEETRYQFSEIYYCLKQLEQINAFLDTLEKDFNSLAAKVNDRGRAILPPIVESMRKEAVEAVPLLDKVFLPPLPTDEKGVCKTEILHKFFERKKIQLQLWQARIQERKVQREFMQKEQSPSNSQRSSPEISEIDFKVKDALLTILSSMDRKSRTILNTFFKPDNSCKPQNILFQDIEKLIRQVGGLLQFSGSGSSHFSISLPNTYLVSSDNLKIMGGSYRPHGGDEWNLSAHELCKNAFIKAGITPERIEMAENLNLEIKKSEVKNG